MTPRFHVLTTTSKDVYHHNPIFLDLYLDTQRCLLNIWFCLSVKCFMYIQSLNVLLKVSNRSYLPGVVLPCFTLFIWNSLDLRPVNLFFQLLLSCAYFGDSYNNFQNGGMCNFLHSALIV